MLSTTPVSHAIPYTVTRADLVADRQAIFEIWRQHQTTEPTDRYEWLYTANPLGQPSCLLLRDGSGAVIGTAGLTQRDFFYRGNHLRGGHTIDLVVDRTHRSAGPAVQLQRALVGGLSLAHVGFLYGTPIRAAELVQRRVGFQSLDSLHRWTKPLRFGEKLHEIIPVTGFRKIAGYFLDHAAALLSGELFFKRSRNWRPAMETGFDSRFDALWAHAKRQFEIIGDRSSAFLSWRFGQHTPTTYRIFSLSNSQGTLAGFVVFSCTGTTANIADFMFAMPQQLRPLLLGFSCKMRSEGMSDIALTCITSPTIAATLRRSGFFRRPEKSCVLIYSPPNESESLRLLSNPNNWFFTDADRDV